MDGEGVGVGVGRAGGQGEMQAASILIVGDPARAGQLHTLDGPRKGGRSPGQSLNEQFAVARPDEGEGVQDIAFRDEADAPCASI